MIEASGQQFANCHFYNNGRYGVFFDGNGSRVAFVSCKISGSNQHGMNLDSTNGGFGDVKIFAMSFQNNGDSAHNTYDHIIIQGPGGNGIARPLIIGCEFNSTVGNKARYGVNLGSNPSQDALIAGNAFGPNANFGTAKINGVGSASFPAMIRDNQNWITENSGTATINSGATSVTVTHGLAVTPTLDDISVVLGENPTNDPGNVWVDTITATQFNINCRNDPGASNLDVAWQAVVL